MPTVTLRVHVLMQERGMSLHDLERAAQINYRTALELARGRYERIGLDTIARLCMAFNCQPGDLFELSAN